jgi:hypothetical protein
MSFKKAERKKIKLKLALTGPSGSGKTYSSLLLAQGLGGKIAVIDSENGSASLYSDLLAFDVLDVAPPHTTDKYVNAINLAVKNGYDVVVLDSMSHIWAGEGGLLAKKESIDATGRGNSYTNWATISKEFETFKSYLLNAPIHVVATMRSKQDYSQETDDKGKKVIRKIGLAPVQRDGIEYEFSVVFDLAMTHEASASKDRTGLFDGRYFKITPDIGKELNKWLETGAVAAPIVAPQEPKEVNTSPSSKPPLPVNEDADDPLEKALGETFNDVTFVVGQYATKKVSEVLKLDSASNFKYAKDLTALVKKGSKITQPAQEYLQLCKIEGVEL